MGWTCVNYLFRREHIRSKAYLVNPKRGTRACPANLFCTSSSIYSKFWLKLSPPFNSKALRKLSYGDYVITISWKTTAPADAFTLHFLFRFYLRIDDWINNPGLSSTFDDGFFRIEPFMSFYSDRESKTKVTKKSNSRVSVILSVKRN